MPAMPCSSRQIAAAKPATDALAAFGTCWNTAPLVTPEASSHSRSRHWLREQGCDALSIALIGGVDTARRVAVVIPLDDSFPVRAEAAGCLFNALTGPRSDAERPDSCGSAAGSDWCSAASTAGSNCSYRQIGKVLFDPSSIPAGRGWKTQELRGRTIRLCKPRPRTHARRIPQSAAASPRVSRLTGRCRGCRVQAPRRSLSPLG